MSAKFAGEPDSTRLPARISGVLPEMSQFAVVVMWASTFILTKNAFDDIAPLAFIFARFVIITALSLSVLAVQGRRRGWARYWRIERSHWSALIAGGLLGYTAYQLLFTIGLDNASPFTSSLLVAMMPLFALAIVTAMGERPAWTAWAGVTIAIGGVAIFLADRTGGTNVFGVILSLGAACAFGAYGIVLRPVVRAYPAETVSAYATVCGAMPLLLITLPEATRQDWSAVPTATWLVMAYMSIFPVYVAYMMWNWAIGQRGVAATSWSLLVPIVSGVFSALFFAEPLGALKVVGAACAILGLVVMRRRPDEPAMEAA